MPTTVALLRVSTDKQSIEAQRVALERHALAHKLTVNAWLEEHATSGASRDRPVLEALMADARAGKLQTLLVVALDRLGRSTIDTLLRMDELDRLGVRVISLREGFDLKTPIGRAIMTILAALAQLERENTTLRTAAALDGGVDEEGHRISVYGTRLGRPAWRWRAEDLAEVHRLVASGKSPEHIARDGLVQVPLRALVDGVVDEVYRVPSASAIRRALAGGG